MGLSAAAVQKHIADLHVLYPGLFDGLLCLQGSVRLGLRWVGAIRPAGETYIPTKTSRQPSMVEIRKDYFTEKLSIVSGERGPRVPAKHLDHGKCPFCPGNEAMTPPADLVLVKMGETLVKQTDTEGERITGLGRASLPEQVPRGHAQRARLLRRVPALQRAGHGLPLRRRRDAQPRATRSPR